MKMKLAMLLGILITNSAAADEDAIRQVLRERYPQISIHSISPAPIPGLFEVYANGQIVYTDKQGDYLLAGPLKETRTKVNLTQQRLEALQTINFSSLPLDKAILVQRGNGERKIAVFSDPDCPYCKALEKELAMLDNVLIYTFLYPLEDLHPGATVKANAIWCAPDRGAAWSAYMLHGKLDASIKQCATPVQDLIKLGAQLGVQGTPAMIFSDGKRIEGAIPVAEIEKQLSNRR
ncbi:MAG: DsbC family protein [Thiobacillus sp.]|nr:DsbC family protein [Thiobacillus sp.]